MGCNFDGRGESPVQAAGAEMQKPQTKVEHGANIIRLRCNNLTLLQSCEGHRPQLEGSAKGRVVPEIRGSLLRSSSGVNKSTEGLGSTEGLESSSLLSNF